MNMLRYIALALGTLWAVPVTLLGLLYLLVAKVKKIELVGWVIRVRVEKLMFFPKWAAGLTLGSVVFVSEGSTPIDTWDHEMVHVNQCRFWGPFMLVLYPLGCVQSWLAGGDPYRHNPFESQAYDIGQKSAWKRIGR